MIYVGIDPGLEGALAFLGSSAPRLRKMPTLQTTKTKKEIDEQEVRKILEQRRSRISHVFIEKVNAMPGQGVTSCFNFGAGWGLLRGICVGLHLPYVLVHPATWKKVMCRDLPKDSKQVSVIVAKRLWPDINLRSTPRCRKDDDNMADALCIAEYGRRALNVL